ncbi:MAG: 7,8-didemethyl-8-hydroxy-5-deazariboflavin synthase subunit CofG [Cyanobacteria bacterium J06623_5]
MERIVTYSPAYTLVPTYECFNRCSYCNFRVAPGEDEWMSLDAARKRLRSLQTQDVVEILILSGEVHPRSPRRSAWLKRIYDLCVIALDMGFLPHTNAGPLSFEEMAQLREVNVSMGLMVEQVSPKLMETVHAHAPSKQPQVRLQQLEFAGQLQIPFTTGLLLGLGESEDDWRESLDAIACSHRQYGHIQEVILQPHQPGQRQQEVRSPCHGRTLLRAVTLARQILPADITLQIPPNLIRSETALLACLDAGVRDLGGIVPKDEVNPDYTHRSHSATTDLLQQHGWKLQPRLPVYPQYIEWLSLFLQQVCRKRAERNAV